MGALEDDAMRHPVLAERWAVRPLGSRDLWAIGAHLLALGVADRERRFHALLDDAAIAAYVAQLDLDRTILLGAVRRGELLGLAEARLDDPVLPRTAEVAVSVAAQWRGLGIGRRLVKGALERAFTRGATRAELYFMAENRAIQALVRALGAQIDAARGRAVLRRAMAEAA